MNPQSTITHPAGPGHGDAAPVETGTAAAPRAQTLKIMLVDDSPSFVSTLRQCLNAVPGATVVGQAYDGQMALTRVDEYQPDLILMDISMPEMNGLEVAQRMMAWPRRPRTIFLSVHDNAAYRAAAHDVGACALVSKADVVAQLLPEIERLVAEMNPVDAVGGTPDPAIAPTAELSQQAIDLISDGVLTIAPDGSILSVNSAAERMFGYARDELRGTRGTFLKGPLTSTETLDQLRRAIARGQALSGEVLAYRRNASAWWAAFSLLPVVDTVGGLKHFVAILRDLSALQAQDLQRKFTDQVIAQSREAIIVTDAQGNILKVNQAFTDISGFTQSEVLGQNPRILAARQAQSRTYDEIRDTVRAQGIWRGEVRNVRKDGSSYVEWLTVSSVRDADGNICNYVGTFIDISEQQEARARIDWLSHYDALTGLPNRSQLAEQCTRAIKLARETGKAMAMVVLGLDQFKLVNEAQGRARGDQVLQQVAHRLSHALQEHDALARIGGDEFALLLQCADVDCARQRADQLAQVASRSQTHQGQDLTVSSSIGIAMYPDDGSSFEALFKAADVAMHQAKQKGPGTRRFFNADMHRTAVAHATLLAALRTAAAQQQLQLHYQPFVDLQTGRICGMEALLRFHHPVLGTVPPARFIPVAERSGLIMEIGHWVFRQACRDLRDWLDRGIAAPRVSVNISPLQFRDPQLLQQIESTLHEFALTPDMVCIEVTEGALMDDISHSGNLLRSLKALGVELSLDDFGTGYSSLSYLKLFPFDKVKIDQSFVRGLGDNSQDAVIAKVVIAMAHGLGLRVIAEGVEEESQCAFMCTHMCDQIQGYFFSRPLAKGDIEALLLEDRRLPAHLARGRASTRTALVVASDQAGLDAMASPLRASGIATLLAGNAAQAMDVLAAGPVDVVLAADALPGSGGADLLRQIRQVQPESIRMLMAEPDRSGALLQLLNQGVVHRVLTRPWDDRQLCGVVEEALWYKDLVDENRQLNEKVRTANHKLAGRSRTMQQAMDTQLRQMADTERTLAVVREALQCLPVPVLGLDDDGLVAFVNARAQELFAGPEPLLGSHLERRLPALHEVLQRTPEGGTGVVGLPAGDFQVHWQRLGRDSHSRGRIVTLGSGARQDTP